MCDRSAGRRTARSCNVQTAEGEGPSPKLRHYVVSRDSGTVSPILESQPEWAAAYWVFKSDRSAPGIGSLMIDVEQKMEIIKVGTGQAGAVDREANPIGGNVGNIETMAKANDQNQKANVVRLTLLGETISRFVIRTSHGEPTLRGRGRRAGVLRRTRVDVLCDWRPGRAALGRSAADPRRGSDAAHRSRRRRALHRSDPGP